MARVALTLVQFIIVLRYAAHGAAHGAAPAGDYFQLPLGWDIASGNDDLQSIGPCNSSKQPYSPPHAVLDICDSNPYCLATNFVPVQAGVTTPDKRCAWLKTAAENNNIAAFVHRRRCNRSLNATLVHSNASSYKFCPTVGDAFYDVMGTIAGGINGTSYAVCQNLCTAEPDCAACQTDGHNCTLLTVHGANSCGPLSKPGCDAWFKMFNHSGAGSG